MRAEVSVTDVCIYGMSARSAPVRCHNSLSTGDFHQIIYNKTPTIYDLSLLSIRAAFIMSFGCFRK
jgi:hypothetical protein